MPAAPRIHPAAGLPQPAHSVAVPDPWTALRKFTSARIALGRAGGSVPTAEWLKFSLDHALARDAVNLSVDFEAIADELRPLGVDLLQLMTQAGDRKTYIQRPDLGRILSSESERLLAPYAGRGPFDLAIVIGDGLSAQATQRHAVDLVKQLIPPLQRRGVRLSPIALVRHARVAIMDAIGWQLGARSALILLGERPGLGTADSLGAYLVIHPAPGNTDAQRNCVSNIRPEGLALAQAAEILVYLIEQMLDRQISGVELKDERGEFQRSLTSAG